MHVRERLTGEMSLLRWGCLCSISQRGWDRVWEWSDGGVWDTFSCLLSWCTPQHGDKISQPLPGYHPSPSNKDILTSPTQTCTPFPHSTPLPFSPHNTMAALHHSLRSSPSDQKFTARPFLSRSKCWGKSTFTPFGSAFLDVRWWLGVGVGGQCYDHNASRWGVHSVLDPICHCHLIF